MNNLVLAEPDALSIRRFTDNQLSAASPDVALRRPLVDVVTAFIKASASNSDQTARAYRAAIGSFLAWLDTERGHAAPRGWRPFAQQQADGRRMDWHYNAPAAVLRLVDQSALDAYRDAMSETGATANTLTARIFAVRTFLRVALRDGVLTHDQATNMGIRPYVSRQKRDEKPVGRRLSRDEVRRLRTCAEAPTNAAKRNLAMFDAMLFSALRRSEVVSLTPAMFALDNGRRWLILTGKGQKTRRIKLHDALHKSLETWMSAAGLAWADDRPLFLSVNKADAIGVGCVDANVIERVLNECAIRAELGDVDPHDLRRTAARNAYDNGATLIQVQQWLGHSDPKTTARYIGADFDDAHTAVDCVKY